MTPIRLLRPAGILLAIALYALVGGCGFGGLLPLFNSVIVEVVNDTSFDIAPNIVYDDDTGFLAGAFPAEELATGLVAPGEIVSFNFDCDALGLIFSAQAEQLIPPDISVFAGDSSTVERDDDFQCGDVIRFIFVGDGDDFDVLVSINGQIVG